MKISTIALVSSFLAATACAATTPTPELISARQAYERARTDPSAALVPDSVLSAKQSLDKAEAVHEKDPQSDKERSYAYVAQRRAELAMTLGENARTKQQAEAASAHYVELQDKLRTSAVAQLGAERNQVNQLGTQLAQTEARAARAMESLNKIAQVKEEQRGVVITLDGQVLFVTGKAELLPIARDRLNQVAKSLKDLDDDKLVSIEGFTDSRGADDANQKLSQERANAVKDYLVSQGVKPEKVRAIGRGEANPVASNETPEGRANNRRVEIVVQSSAQAAAGVTGAKP